MENIFFPIYDRNHFAIRDLNDSKNWRKIFLIKKKFERFERLKFSIPFRDIVFLLNTHVRDILNHVRRGHIPVEVEFLYGLGQRREV